MKHFSKLYLVPMMLITISVLSLTGCGSEALSNATANMTTEVAEETNNIYVDVELEDVYSIGYSTGTQSGGVENADGSQLSSASTICVIQDIDAMLTAENNNVFYTLFAYDKDKNLLASDTFLYESGDGSVTILLNKNGNFRE